MDIKLELQKHASTAIHPSTIPHTHQLIAIIFLTRSYRRSIGRPSYVPIYYE